MLPSSVVSCYSTSACYAIYNTTCLSYAEKGGRPRDPEKYQQDTQANKLCPETVTIRQLPAMRERT